MTPRGRFLMCAAILGSVAGGVWLAVRIVDGVT